MVYWTGQKVTSAVASDNRVDCREMHRLHLNEPPHSTTLTTPQSTEPGSLRETGRARDRNVHTGEPAPRWHLYLIECRNGALYAGITNNLERRYAQHVRGTGARYTRANPPLRLIGSRSYPSRSAASRAEFEIRRLPGARKPTYLREP